MKRISLVLTLLLIFLEKNTGIQGTLMKIITLHLLVIVGEGRDSDKRADMWIICR